MQHKHERKMCVACSSTYDRYDWAIQELLDPPPIAQCKECSKWVCSSCKRYKNHTHPKRRARKTTKKVVEVVEEEPDSYCTHECCRGCCTDNGCDMSEAWPADRDDDDDPEF